MSGAEIGLIKEAYFLARDVYFVGQWTYRAVKSASHRDEELQALQKDLKGDLEIVRSFIVLFLQDPESCVGAPIAPVMTALENLQTLYSSEAAKLALPELQQDQQYLAFQTSQTNYLTGATGFVIEDVPGAWEIEPPSPSSGPLLLTAGPSTNLVGQSAAATAVATSQQNVEQPARESAWSKTSKGIMWVLKDKKKIIKLHKNARVEIYAIRDNAPLFAANQARIDRNRANAQRKMFFQQFEAAAASLGLPEHRVMRQLTGTDTSDTTNSAVSEVVARFENLALDDEYEFELKEESASQGVLRNREDEEEQVLVEYKKWRPSSEEEYSTKTEREVKKLAKMLAAARGPHFPTLNFRGYINQEDEMRYAFLFAYPKGAEISKPISLQELFLQDRIEGPMRLHIAQVLVKNIAKFHADGWLHKSVCSHSVVFFRNQSSKAMYNAPYLVDFEYARPQSDDTYFNYNNEMDRLVYIHPDRLESDRRKFCVEHDLYSLGVVLLEIGLWKKAASIFGEGLREAQEQDIEAAGKLQQEKLIAAAEQELPFLMSENYATAVVALLSSKSAEKLEGAKFGKNTITSVMELVSFKSLEPKFGPE